MAIITFLSDFGMSDHYVAGVKARILGVNPGLRIVDISHEIEPCNLAHGAYVLKSVFREFPEGTVHLAAVDSAGSWDGRYIAVQLEGHIFVGPDNGLFSLISDKDPVLSVSLQRSATHGPASFPELAVLGRAAAMLASGSALNDVGTRTTDIIQLIDRKSRATKSMISGHVVRVDHFGNLITNIEKEVFDILHKNRDYVVSIGREKIGKIHSSYGEVESGDCFVLFNYAGLLEVGINKGNASQLLGMRYDSQVNIIFDPDE
jgi:S-adenosylmethionine hydrolase